MLLAGIAAMGSMAIHMLIPALPLIAAGFKISEAAAQQIVSVYLIGLGAGQLVAGQFVDRLGRRPVLLAGLIAYGAGAAGAYFSSALPALLVARVLQAVGGAAGVVSARVIVGDSAGPEEGAGRQATLMMVVLISPALAPAVGGTIASTAGWRSIFAVLAAASFAALFVAWRKVSETRPQRNANATHSLSGSLLGGYRKLLADRRFLGAAGALAAMSSALYMFLANASFLLIGVYGLSPRGAGFAFLIIAVGGIAGTRLVASLERHTDALIAGVAIGVMGTMAALTLALVGLNGPVALIAPLMLLGAGAGIAGPAGIGRAISVDSALAGTAASLAGASQMLISACSTNLIGYFTPLSSTELCFALVIATTFAALFAILSRL
ncbi:MFS transporter [Novosphingobium sp. ZN18A2]|uniref:MFS transporter n=1 Tax=Novosphingobium sp. ZN18A2 TaxID=3079861 RepID=UPI0030D55AC6